MLESFSFFFQVLIYVGIGLPILNILIGAFGGSGDTAPDADIDMDLDIDVDLEIGEADADFSDLATNSASTHMGGPKSPIQFNLYCLCLGMVIWGSMGVYAINTSESTKRLILLLVAAFLVAVGAYCFLYRVLVRTLKENDASALNINKLLHQHALVSFRILPDSPGQIQARDSVGATISYRAQLDKDICTVERIKEGEEVIITEIDAKNSLCYVAPAERKILTRPPA